MLLIAGSAMAGAEEECPLLRGQEKTFLIEINKITIFVMNDDLVVMRRGNAPPVESKEHFL